MYFDVDFKISLDQNGGDLDMHAIENYVCSRNGHLILSTENALVFSAPFYRVNGFLYFLTKQMPLGVSFGVFDVINTPNEQVLRVRISLFWLRCYLATVLILMGISGTHAITRNNLTLLYIFGACSAFLMLIYWAGRVSTRHAMRKLVQSQEEEGGGNTHKA